MTEPSMATFLDHPADSTAVIALPTVQAHAVCNGCDAEATTSHRAPRPFVYAIGRIESRFPSLAVEKEFAQAVGRAETAGMTDGESFHDVLSRRENRYLVRQLCWVLSIQGMDTYLLAPRDPMDLDLLVEALRPRPNANDLDVVIGLRGPIAGPEVCNGLMIPIVLFDQIYSFSREELIASIPVPQKSSAQRFEAAAEELFNRITQITDNAGATDEDRAANYAAMRVPSIYAKTAEQFASASSLTGVEMRSSPLSTTRNIIDIIFSFTDRATDFTERFAVRVDVTDQFPFLLSRLAPYVTVGIN